MSIKSGMAALNFEFTDHVPRTEYSAKNHWELVQKVTGIDTSVTENRQKASQEFVKTWDYAFIWNTNISRNNLIKRTPYLWSSKFSGRAYRLIR